jgi:type II secretory pathway pseudopilin PulG
MEQGYQKLGVMHKNRPDGCCSKTDTVIPGCKNGRDYGFTLIELSVIVFILMMITAVALPGLSGTIRILSLKTAAREIGSTCRLARSLAVTSKNEHKVIIDPEKGIFRIEGPGAEKEYSGTRKIPKGLGIKTDCREEDDYEDRTTGEDEEGRLVFVFFPGGFTSGGCFTIYNSRNPGSPHSFLFCRNQ